MNLNHQSGRVLALYLSTSNKEVPRSSYREISIDSKGVIGDKFYDKDKKRSILLASQKSYLMAQEAGIKLYSGDLGENILIDIDPYTMQVGQRLKIGTLMFELSQNGTLCQGLSRIHAKLPKLLKHDRGIFLQALNSGKIKIGDSVTIL